MGNLMSDNVQRNQWSVIDAIPVSISHDRSVPKSIDIISTVTHIGANYSPVSCIRIAAVFLHKVLMGLFSTPVGLDTNIG